ncbi:hypothetical protein Pcinc_027016 [Petrolisthes cinctipes]|uniref:Uncharacterized protein n=1 Tax=Petrolisthes cinctipes TaxID=88211 RepID=A0AAE1K9F4_PETCI|nr:hypothetical protein Pcinc_027016 [Petrolisthes cinctipes]
MVGEEHWLLSTLQPSSSFTSPRKPLDASPPLPPLTLDHPPPPPAVKLCGCDQWVWINIHHYHVSQPLPAPSDPIIIPAPDPTITPALSQPSHQLCHNHHTSSVTTITPALTLPLVPSLTPIADPITPAPITPPTLTPP